MPTNDNVTNGAGAGGIQEGGDAVVGGLQSFLTEIGQALPEILAAAVALLVGIIIAGILGGVARKLVIWSRVDHLIRKSSAPTGALDQEEAKVRAADVVGKLVKWFVILLAIAVTANILQWTQITDLVNRFIAYVPNIAAALLLLAGGYLLGSFVGSLVSGMGGDAFGQRMTRAISGIARWAIFVLAAMAALIQLGIAESIIHIAFIGLMAMISLAGGLAFGLGGRDKARDLLSDIGSQRPMAA